MPSSALLLALLLACAPARPGQGVQAVAVSASTAQQAAGQVATVTGQVVQVKDHAHHGFAYLNFGGRYPDHTFSVLIPDSAVAKFGDLSRFEGHRARATGLVWLQDGKWPAMTLTDPAALELLP
ncbi:MAG: hypothetical protein ABJB33_04695 [Gemmatimonadota bacterium]